MTKAETLKLDAIIARVETLQAATKDQTARDLLGRAKSHLIALFMKQDYRP